MEPARPVAEIIKDLDKILEKKNVIIGQGRMLHRVLELTAPIRHQLPPAYLAALARIDFTQEIEPCHAPKPQSPA